MNRTVKDKRENRPKPVTKIKLSDKHVNYRVIFVAFLIVIGVIALVYSINGFFSVETGWTEIETDSSLGVCSSEFVFRYNIGSGEESPAEEKKKITSLYSDGIAKVYQLFQSNEKFDGVNNMYYINCHPNEVIEVDSILYEAFELLENLSNRSIYLAPVYNEYQNLFFCQNDFETIHYDPYQNSEVLEYFSDIVDFVRNEKEICIELLGDNKIKLFVSDNYLEYANEIGFDEFIDFFWMKNAFIIDYLADIMIENGYTFGTISSYDGYTRNLDASGTNYSLSIQDKNGESIYPAGVIQYGGPLSIVYLRNYPLTKYDVQHFYKMETGEIRTAYIDIEDGLCKSSTSDLIGYSSEVGCAEAVLKMAPVFISNQFNQEKLTSLCKDDIFLIYCEGTLLKYNDPELIFTDLYNKDGIVYDSELIEVK